MSPPAWLSGGSSRPKCGTKIGRPRVGPRLAFRLVFEQNCGMPQEIFEITIQSDGSADPDGLEEAGIQLGEELREIAGVSVSRVLAESSPPGTRSAGEWISAVVVVTALAGRVAAREHL